MDCVRNAAGCLVDAFAEIANGDDRLGDIDRQRIGNRLAHYQSLEQRKIGRICFHQIGEAMKDRHPVARRHVAPAPVVPRSPCRCDSAVDIGGCPVRHSSHERAVGRIYNIKAATRCCLAGASVDEQAGFDPQIAGPALPFGMGERRHQRLGTTS